MNRGGVPASSIASPGRRLLAGVLNATIFLAGMGGPVAIGVQLYRRDPRIRRWLRSTRRSSRMTELMRSPAEPKLPVRWRRALWVASAVGTILGRNWRGPGERILGIRRVDARTGGPVSVRSALISFAAAEGWKRVIARIYGPRQRRAAQRLTDLQPALRDILEAHRDDPQARHQATMRFYRDQGVNPMSSCLWQLPGMMLPQLLALRSSRRQSASDWLAGTVVVREQ